MKLYDNPQLTERFKDGERDVLEKVYLAYRDDVEDLLRYGFSFTSKGTPIRFDGFTEPFRLREAVQDGFIHAFRESARQQYDPSRKFRPYLLSIVRNHLIDGFRRDQIESDLFVAASEVAAEDESQMEALNRIGGEATDEAGPEQTPERETMRAELATMLRDFLETLDAKDRRVVRRHMLGDLTQHEMAEALGTNRNDVRKRIRMIRRQLLGHLKREGFIGQSTVDDVFESLARMGVILESI